MTVVLGEMDVARAKPKAWLGGSQPERKVPTTWDASLRAATTANFEGRLEICPLPGRPPGTDYIGRWGIEDGVWKGQKGGSV